MSDVCVLTNSLVRLLQQTENAPSTTQLTKLFDDVEKAQRFPSKVVQVLSAVFADFETQSTWWAPAFKYVFAATPAWMKAQLFCVLDKFAPRLDAQVVEDCGSVTGTKPYSVLAR